MSNNSFTDLVILYCPSKVGSTSIASSIRFSAIDKYYVFHTHTDKILKVVTGELSGDISVSAILNNSLNPITGQKRKIFVIDVYRPTIEKRISEFFQDIALNHFNNTEENISKYKIDRLIKRFNDVYPHIAHVDYYKEMYDLPESEINTQFDHNTKYMKYTKDNITYLKLRLIDFKKWVINSRLSF